MSRELRVLVQWEEIIHEILALSQRFPKSARQVVSNRLGNLAMDGLEQIITAQYSHHKEQNEILQSIQIELTKIRVMLRIATDEKWMSLNQCANLISKIDTVGKGIHGWEKKNTQSV